MLGKKIIPFLAFFIVANPRMFMLTGKVLGPRIADDTGRPTQMGVLLHALVYVLLCHLMWILAFEE
jgi:hypothetical protein